MTEIDAKALALYEKLVATQEGMPRRGKANPYTSLNGHMFSFLTKESKLALRLGKDEREAFLKRYKTELAVSHNTVMKEYVLVPDRLLAKTSQLAKYFALSVEYIQTLKPKPTTRKKAAAKKKATVKKKATASKATVRKT